MEIFCNIIHVMSPQGNRYDQEKLLKQSCTLYVGNLSFYTTEEQVHELFSKSGDVKRIIIGLDKVKKTACGFCFVEYPFSFSNRGCEMLLYCVVLTLSLPSASSINSLS